MERIPFCQPKLWKESLARNGYVVIEGFIPNKECELFIDDAWTIIETLTDGKLNRNDPSTQACESNYFPTVRCGMIPYLGHSRLQWLLRKRCKPIFAELWQTQDLKCSFDCLCFMNGVLKKPAKPLNDFLHSDQGALRDYPQCYQGLICLTDNGPDEGGFVVAPSSHIIHNEYIRRKGESFVNDYFYRCDEEDLKRQPFRDCVKVDNQAGDFILWDSRTFHTNVYPQKLVQRVCAYVCMLPESHLSAATLAQRKKAWQRKIAGSHNPANGFTLHREVEHYITPATPHLRQALNSINGFQMDSEMLRMV